MGGDSFGTANAVLSGIFSFQNFNFDSIVNKFQAMKGMLLIGILLLIEVSNIYFRWNERQLDVPAWRVTGFAVLLWLIALFGTFGGSAFIYFQF
jgi:hypothetical protein